MADLIDRQAALELLKFKPIDDGGVVDDCIMQVLALAKSKINKLSAVDAVEVVRCKDCKHYENHRLKIYENCVRDGRLFPMKPDDFCSYGVRREENAAD